MQPGRRARLVTDLTAQLQTRDCSAWGCTREADATDGLCSEHRVRPSRTRAESAEIVLALRAQGLLQREIVQRTGLSRSYVAALITDPSGEVDAARKDSYRGECLDCGAPTTGNNGPAHTPERCVKCTAQLHKVWTRDVVIESIQEWARRRGFPPTANDWISKTVDPDGYVFPARTSVYRSSSNSSSPFDSWADAIEAAGFRRPRIGYKTTHWRETGMEAPADTNGAKRKTVTTRPYLVFRAREDGALELVDEVDAQSTQEAVEQVADGEGTYSVCPRSNLQTYTLRPRLVAERQPVRQAT